MTENNVADKLNKNKCFAILSFIKLSNHDHLKTQILFFSQNHFQNQFDACFEENYFLKFGKKKKSKGGTLIKKKDFVFFPLKIIKNC
jgi:hypothetical protein